MRVAGDANARGSNRDNNTLFLSSSPLSSKSTALGAARVVESDMDPISVPRLRLPRYSPQHSDQALTPIAGPSQNPNFLHTDDGDDDDADSTPRMTASEVRFSPRSAVTAGLPPADNPTARLRALLARVPNAPNGATPQVSSSRPMSFPSGSEPDSDFEPPLSMVTTSSIARESLKELFSHALREPGNTPRKVSRPRRNSIDGSEVEASPLVDEERVRHKAKRRVYSDEEADKSSMSLRPLLFR